MATNPKNVNTRLTDKAITHSAMIERLKNGQARDVTKFMRDELGPDVFAKLNAELIKLDGKTSLTKRRRLGGLVKSMDVIIKKETGLLFTGMEGALSDIADLEAANEVRLINGAIPKEIKSAGFVVSEITADTLENTIANVIVNGNTIKQTVDQFKTGFTNSISRELGIGFASGENIVQLTSRIKGVINTQTRHAQTISRTSMTAISANIREEVYKNNEDIIKGVRWVSTLDTRTSEICQSLDGRVFDVGEGIRPPAHPNCRSTTVPVTKSWQELGIDKDDLPEGTRRAMDGKVPANITYNDWIKDQSKETQEMVLGPTKAKLLRENNLDVTQFVNRIGEPLTIDEIREREGIPKPRKKE